MLREGEVRYNWGNTPTDYGFTGQYSHQSDFGLMFYNARYYDSSLGRFTSADTIIPGNQGVQAWDRYAYTNNNPLRYTDPTGHRNCEEDGYNCPGDAYSSNDSCWDDPIGCLQDLVSTVGATMNYWKSNPPTVINGKIKIPVVIGSGINPPLAYRSGHGFTSFESGVVMHSIDANWVRNVGRLADDLAPVTLLAGLTLTVAPQQLQDFGNDASFTEHYIDFQIDGTGFVVSEIAGDAAGIFSAEFVGPLAIPISLVVDQATGIGWDALMYKTGLRDGIVNGANDFQQFQFDVLQASQNRPVLPSGIVPIPAPAAPYP